LEYMQNSIKSYGKSNYLIEIQKNHGLLPFEITDYKNNKKVYYPDFYYADHPILLSPKNWSFGVINIEEDLYIKLLEKELFIRPIIEQLLSNFIIGVWRCMFHSMNNRTNDNQQIYLEKTDYELISYNLRNIIIIDENLDLIINEKYRNYFLELYKSLKIFKNKINIYL
jgi:hypothetical protein